MGLMAMEEGLAVEVAEWETPQQFQRSMRAATTGEFAAVVPSDHIDDRLLRVLIVDDHRATANTLSGLIRIWGHDVRQAYDGVTGLALTAAFRPDVLLLDILMPGLNGFEVAGQVRRHEDLQDCFIIAVTGRTNESHRCQCYEAGVDLCLVKPVLPAHMQTLLTLEWERRQSRQMAFSLVRTWKATSHPLACGPLRRTRVVT